MRNDNKSQLTAASKNLRDAISDLNWETLQRYGAENEMEWKFSPADEPWYNGGTESLIKSIKQALNAAVGESILSFSEL